MSKWVVFFFCALVAYQTQASAREFPSAAGLADEKNFASYSGVGGYSGVDNRGIPFSGVGGGVFGTGGLGGTSSYGGVGGAIGTMPSGGLGGIGVIPAMGGGVAPGGGIGGAGIFAPGVGGGAGAGVPGSLPLP